MAHEEKVSFKLLEILFWTLRRQHIYFIPSAFKNIVGA